MSTGTLIERVETAARLWKILLPFCSAPTEYQYGIWSRQFSDGQLEYAFTRASRKFGPTKGPCPDALVIHKWITGVLVSEARKVTA